MSHRINKVNELFKREIAKEVYLRFPDDIITITEVSVSKDLSYAKVYVSSVKDASNVAKTLNQKAFEIRLMLAKEVPIRKVPVLKFIPDLRPEQAGSIEKLLEKIKKDDRRKK